MTVTCGEFPEISLDSFGGNNILNITTKPGKLGVPIPSGVALNPDFLESSKDKVNNYIGDVETYAKCNAEKYVTNLVPDQDVINDLVTNANSSIRQIEKSTQDYTNETIDVTKDILEESNFVISLILTLLTCLIIFLALNIITNWLTYGKYQGLIIVVFLVLIFGVVFYIFYYKFYNIILVSFNKLLDNDITSKHGWKSDMETNQWVDYAPYVLVILLILAVAILVLNNTYNVLKKGIKER